jgi:hypothetical protein
MQNEIDETTNRAKIYSQLFTELIDRKYSKDGQLEVLENVKKDDLRELIREIAFAIFETGDEYITKNSLMRLEATQSFLKLLPGHNFKDSIKGIMIAFYFKETPKEKNDEFDDDKSNYAIEFLHKSLREYMTAEKIFNTISYEFLDKRRGGRYVIDTARAALEQISKTFSKQDLTTEIKYHLAEIIRNSEIDKEELCDRLFHFFPDFVSNDFLVQFEYNHNLHPVNISMRCFVGFWTVVSLAGLKKNYLTSNTKERVADYFQILKQASIHLTSVFRTFQNFP